MALNYDALCKLLTGRRLPAAFVDLDAFDRNLDRVLTTIEPHGLPLRVATKSLRVTALLERLQRRGGNRLRGLMCFSVEEAVHLHRNGFDNLLVAYPVWQRADIAQAIELVRSGCHISLMSDSRKMVDRVSAQATRSGVELRLVLDMDMSLKLAAGRIHLGVRRSPLHQPQEVIDLAHHVQASPGVRFWGVMGYEAQVAGLGDDNPFEPLLNPIKTAIRSKSIRELAVRRNAVVAGLRAAGLDATIVNGGGSGSLDTTTAATGVTEVTAGSAFLKPHLFDYYKSPQVRRLEPAAFFALEVTRKPAANLVTCLGGGYVASGASSQDKMPLPWLPTGLKLLAGEMCGEVQTPLLLPPQLDLEHGSPVIFRHAKAGELAERFENYILIQDGAIVEVVPTYRGQGRCFF